MLLFFVITFSYILMDDLVVLGYDSYSLVDVSWN